MTNTQHERIYVEAWKPNLYNPNWAATIEAVNPEVYRPELGGMVGLYSASLWPCYHKIIGSTVTVVFVSNNSFSRVEAIQIAANILAGKVRPFEIDLS